MLSRHMDRDLKQIAQCKNNMQYQPVILGACMLLINIGRSGCTKIGERDLFCIRSLKIFQILDLLFYTFYLSGLM